MEPRLSLITLGVEDLDRAIAFYRDTVGWQPASVVDGDVAFFDLGGVILALWRHRDLAADSGVASDALGSYHGFALAHNVRSRAEVDALFAHLAERGGSIAKWPVETDWGGYSGYFVDPDGHHWEIAHNPFWTIRDDGRIDLQGDRGSSG
ncbi:MAG TPA: VOC family protein [Candidatus Limnocylindrales bacterium]|nr:VOC family protein [Candidatus Limnocylindrales bacterium]